MTDHAPTVSVVIPFRDRFDLVHEAIDSVLRQTMRSVEVILVDDDSQGQFSMDRYGQSTIRITYFRNEKNLGPAASRFIGLSNCMGEFVVFLDSDDLLAETYLERQIETMRRLGKPTFVYCYTKLFNSEGIISDRPVPQILVDRILPDVFLNGRVWCTSACLWNRSVLEQITPFEGFVWEDYRMDVSAALLDNRIGTTPEYLCLYRVDSEEKLSDTLDRDYFKTLQSVDGILRTIYISQKRFPEFDCVMAKMRNKYLTCLIKLNREPAIEGYYEPPHTKMFPGGLRYWLFLQRHLPLNIRLMGLRVAKRIAKRAVVKNCRNAT